MWLSKCRIVSVVNHAMKLSPFCSYMGNSAIPVVIWNNKKYLFCEEWLDYFDTACDWNVQIYLHHCKLLRCEHCLWFSPLRFCVHWLFPRCLVHLISLQSIHHQRVFHSVSDSVCSFCRWVQLWKPHQPSYYRIEALCTGYRPHCSLLGFWPSRWTWRLVGRRVPHN